MRILHRYVLSEFLKVFGLSLGVITLFILLVGIYRIAHEQGLGIAQVTPLIPFVLPDALRFAIPGTILFAACSVYGRLSGQNEIVAIKSLGISPMVIVWPTLILTFLLSLVAVWLNDVGVVWGYEGGQRVIMAEVDDIAYSMLRMQRSYSNRKVSINVKDVQGRKLIRPVVSFAANEDSPEITITAQQAELKADLEAKTFSMVFLDSTMEVEGQASVYYPGEFERVMSLDDATKTSKSNSPVYIPMSLIPGEVEKRREQIAQRESNLSVRAAFNLVTGDFEGLTADSWRTADNSLRDEVSFIHRLNTEPTRRWANGFSCLCFVLIGAPLAMWWRNSDTMFIFFVCFGPILIVYYPLLAFGLDAAKRGALSPHCVWLGNAILACWGLWLLQKVLRY
jgi:lipopolysaccharide export system permease protein